MLKKLCYYYPPKHGYVSQFIISDDQINNKFDLENLVMRDPGDDDSNYEFSESDYSYDDNSEDSDSSDDSDY